MTRLETAHTSALDPAVLDAARALLEGVFAGEFEPEDWEHSLGGLHALVWEDGELVAHGAVIQRRLVHRGRALRTGYVEGVGVRADRRRRGHGAAVMTALGDVIRRAYDLGALGATDEAVPLYTGLSWRKWEGATYALTPDGVRRTADDDAGVYVLPVAPGLDLRGDLTCDWRDGDVW
jgi:aminoglycoside 2'-N-acetyltransferase I